MGHANTSRIGKGWMRAFAERIAAFRIPNWNDKPSSSLPTLLQNRPSTHISLPGWVRFLRSETFLRRLIPVLIGLLLLFVALARTSSLITYSENIEKDARHSISLLSQLTAQRLSLNPSLSNSMASPTLAEVFLNDALGKNRIGKGLSVHLLDSQGRLAAQSPLDRNTLGIMLNRLTGGEDWSQMTGDRSSIRSILLDGETTALAQYTRIPLADSEMVAGLLIVQKQTEMYASWHQFAKLNVTLFVAISSVLLVILYAYFAQGARVRESDSLYIETNARFDTALSRGHCGLWDWDLSRGRIVWSSSMYQMLGIPPTDRVMGFGELEKLTHPDDQDLMSLANQVFQSEQRQIDHRFRMMHSSGSWVWMRLRAELVRYKGSDPHLIGIAVDISEQEALKQKSRDADVRLRDAIENISEAFVLWDSKKRMVMCNSKYQQLYNLPASAVTSGAAHQDVMSKSRKPLAKHLVPTHNSFENGANTYELEIENGSWLQISERRTRDGGFVSVGTDITQIKRNQAELFEAQQSNAITISDLQNAKETLELQATTLEESERTKAATIDDLQNSKRMLELQAQQLVEFADNLSEQKKKADAGNKAKSEFLANISHELRTPLNAIIGFSDIMRSEMFGPLGSNKYEEYADDIHGSGNFLLGVIDDVLDMSKIEAGRFQLNPEPVQLNDLLEETLRIIQMQADDANITVSHKIPKRLEMEADRRAVKQILLNLLSNAVKFTPKEGHIKVTARGSNSNVKITITDNGIGISKEALKRLGQPFEQVQSQFTKNHKGSGLGLAIARSLSQLHGGTLEISSEPSLGTKVVVTLPLKCQSSACQDDADAGSQPSELGATGDADENADAA